MITNQRMKHILIHCVKSKHFRSIGANGMGIKAVRILKLLKL